MGFQFCLTLSLCALAMFYLHGTQATDTCLAKLSAIRELLDGDDGIPQTCTSCQGRPGKRGFVGPSGPRGEKGDSGSCECDLSMVETLMERIDELERFRTQTEQRNYPEYCYAGVSNGKIPVSDISASSFHPHCPVKNGRLNYGGGWCAGAINANQWIQVDLRVPSPITGVLTQGRANCCGSGPQYVTSYKVSYGNSMSSMAFYQENGSTKVFGGNSNKDDIVKNVFAHPIIARYIRIHPVEYNRYMSMRIELLTC